MLTVRRGTETVLSKIGFLILFMAISQFIQISVYVYKIYCKDILKNPLKMEKFYFIFSSESK